MEPKRLLLVDDLTCPVCYDIFKNPVMLTCSHSLCKDCLFKCWEAKDVRECPMCKKRCKGSADEAPLNLILRNVCEAFQEERDARDKHVLNCSQHKQKLEIYCMEDKEPLCLTCRESEEHKHHAFKTFTEMAPGFKMNLKEKLRPLKKKLGAFNEAKKLYVLTAKHIKTQAADTAKKIRAEVRSLQLFLEEEMMLRLDALRQEEREKTLLMEQKIEMLGRQIASISVKIQGIEEQMEAADASVVLHHKITLDRAQCTLQDPERVSGALINEAKHLGNLKFKVWKEMESSVDYTPVVLNPNTASPGLVLSDDLTVFRYDMLAFHDIDNRAIENPERFSESSCSVLGSEGFTSGIHSWTVEVSDNEDWELGVMEESAVQHDHDNSNYIYLKWQGYGSYYVHSQPRAKPVKLNMRSEPSMVKVTVDLDEGELEFFDPLDGMPIHKLKYTFTRTVYPYFCTAYPDTPLRLLDD